MEVIEGHIVSPEEEVELAMRTLQKYGKVPKRGDSFDIGEDNKSVAAGAAGGSFLSMIANGALSNPGTGDLMQMFNLNQAQAENLRSLIVGSGTGVTHRVLSQYFGDEISAAIGGLISGYIAKKVVKR